VPCAGCSTTDYHEAASRHVHDSAAPAAFLKHVQRRFEEPEVIAHRGASAYARENSFPAYDLAIAQGATTLELDVRVCADESLVVMHDDTLLRTVGDPRRVDALTASCLRELEAEVRPLSLAAVLERYGARTRVLIDLKDPHPAWEGRVVEAIERHGLRDRAVVQSFDHEAIARIRRAAPWLAVAVLYRRHERPERLEAVRSFASGIGPWHGRVDAELVVAAHAHGLAVRPWTVDSTAEMERLIALGVDGLITNMPDVARAALRRTGFVAEAA
jgi:glycerophosphoryl diester phosphodiesterase